MNQQPHEQYLREAWNATSGDSLLSQLSRMSLATSAESRPDLVPALRALQSGRRTELDLHLSGEGVVGHETGAEWFGKFISRTAIAVKEVVKSSTKRVQYSANLQVLAPAPGSVRVVFRSPMPVVKKKNAAIDPMSEADTVEGDALNTVVKVIALAEAAGPDDGALDDSLQRLQGGARNALRLMAQAVVEGQWSVAGELRRGDGRRSDVTLTGAGAQRLVSVASATNADVTYGHVVIGVVDGWTWSEAKMTFIPEEGDSFKAAVPEAIQAKVARLLDNQNQARAVFKVVTSYPPGDEGYTRHTYELTSIDDAPDPLAIDYEVDDADEREDNYEDFDEDAHRDWVHRDEEDDSDGLVG